MNRIFGMLLAIVVSLPFAYAEDPTPAPPAGANASNNWVAPNSTNATVPLNATSAEVESLNITGVTP